MNSRIWHRFYSIRWSLLLSYAGIALLAALALGGLLLFTLERHYDTLERRYLNASADTVARSAEQLFRDREILAEDVFQSSANIYSFLVESRVRLLDIDKQVIADSGKFSNENTLSLDIRKPEQQTDSGEPAPDSNLGGVETFLSIQRERFNPPRDVGQRYPVGIHPEATGRLIAGITSGDARANLSVTVPLFSNEGDILGYLELSESPAFGSEIIENVAEKAVGAGVAAVLLAAVVGWIASRRISRPVLSLADVTRSMAEGNLAARAQLDRRDELGLLARTFNMMAERVENTVVTLKRFVADAAHELNTPMTALRTNLELAAAGDCSDDFRADITRAQAELTRLETLTKGLLTLSRLEAHSSERVRESVDLCDLLHREHEKYASRADQAGVNWILTTPPAAVPVRANEKQLVSVVDNLLDNALKFTPEEGMVTLSLLATPDNIEFSVVDTGIGIPCEDISKVFSRFHRGRNAASYPGNGLGLAITKAIIEDHQGQISVNSDGNGTSFIIHLPSERQKR
ncbi:MAG TPA: HAMP domain-containing sensor histidine kinase [Aggregatilineaceae bacterium]|nr:HAMP domain-containing sensor histidine kinase [Aggregatilineaceae bacterium]